MFFFFFKKPLNELCQTASCCSSMIDCEINMSQRNIKDDQRIFGERKKGTSEPLKLLSLTVRPWARDHPHKLLRNIVYWLVATNLILVELLCNVQVLRTRVACTVQPLFDRPVWRVGPRVAPSTSTCSKPCAAYKLPPNFQSHHGITFCATLRWDWIPNTERKHNMRFEEFSLF